MSGGAPRRPRVLAPRSNPFANDGSAHSFSRSGAPIFRHPTQCRGWHPLLPPFDNSPASRLPSNLRRVEAQLHALRHTLHNITNDVQVIEICHNSNPICGRNCCLASGSRSENNSNVPFPERWWEAPIHSSSNNNDEPMPSSVPRDKGRDEPFVWWAGVVSPGPPLSPLPPITSTTSFAQPSPSTTISGPRASQVQQPSVLAQPHIQQHPTVRPTALSVSSSASSSSQDSSAQRGATKGLSPPSSTTSTAFSSPTVSSRSRSVGNDSITQAPTHRFAHSRSSTTSNQDVGHTSSPVQSSQPTTYTLHPSITQDDSDSGPPSSMGQRDVATLGITASHIPTYPRHHLKAASVQSFSTNTSSSSLPRRRSVSTPASPSSFRRRRQLRARRILPPTHIHLATSPTTPDHSTPLQLPPFSPPASKESAAHPSSAELQKEAEEDEEQERIADVKRRAELARLLADSKPGKTFHPGSGSAMSGSEATVNTVDSAAAVAETENFGIGVVIVSLLLMIALFLLHAQLTQPV